MPDDIPLLDRANAAVAALERVANKPQARTWAGPRPTPRPVTARKRARLAQRAGRRANR